MVMTMSVVPTFGVALSALLVMLLYSQQQGVVAGPSMLSSDSSSSSPVDPITAAVNPSESTAVDTTPEVKPANVLSKALSFLKSEEFQGLKPLLLSVGGAMSMGLAFAVSHDNMYSGTVLPSIAVLCALSVFQFYKAFEGTGLQKWILALGAALSFVRMGHSLSTSKKPEVSSLSINLRLWKNFAMGVGGAAAAFLALNMWGKNVAKDIVAEGILKEGEENLLRDLLLNLLLEKKVNNAKGNHLNKVEEALLRRAGK